MIQNDFEWLSSWYHSHCDGDWEHSARIRISTIDNPGWSISINLEGTKLEEQNFEQLKKENSETHWLICFTKNNVFEDRCGALNLLQLLHIFRNWAEEIEEID